MITLRRRTFESDDSADRTFSKLDWKVEKVERLANPFLNHSTVDTTRPWVGKVDRENRAFEITQTAPPFSPRVRETNFFPLIIYGQILDRGQKSKITIQFRLGWSKTIYFASLFIIPLLATLTYVNTDTDLTVVLFGLMMPLFPTLLLIIQLNRTENRLMDLFGV